MRSSPPPASRTRHLVPSRALALLGLLFRYSHALDAWVLRGIGERHGPVLDVRRSRASEPPAGLMTPPSGDRRGGAPARSRASDAPIGASPSPSRAQPPRGRTFIQRVNATRPAVVELGLLIGAGAVIAAGAGYALAHHATAVNRTPALTAHTATATLTLARPADWRRRPAPADLVALLSGPANLAAPSPGRGSLIIGLAQTPNPQLLPAAVLAGLGHVPSAQHITLGHAAFLRYENLRPKALGGAETLYAASTTRGTLLGICRPHVTGTGFQATCERILATARVIAATPLPAGPIPGYAAALAGVIKRLDSARGNLGARLSAASGFVTQARAAGALAVAHRVAAAAVTRLHAGPAGQANIALATTLNVTAAAYEALSRSASRRARSDYASARGTLGRLTAELGAAFTRLEAFGYRVAVKA